MELKVKFGFDIGSISINTVVMDQDGNVKLDHYDYCHGRPFEKLRSILKTLEETYSKDQIEQISFTGTGGKLGAELVGGSYVNEIVAQSTAVSKFHPEVRTVIEMGGEDSKLIFMDELTRRPQDCQTLN
jgi:activator of 2-hydroxyglutaryl-CoA dehydratase